MWLCSPGVQSVSGCGLPVAVGLSVRPCVVGGTLVSRHSWAFLAITCSQSEPTVPPLSTAVGSQLLSCGPRTGPACCSPWGLASSQPPQSGCGGVTRVRVCGIRSLWEGPGPLLCHRDCLGASPGSATSQLCNFRPAPKLSGLSFPICSGGDGTSPQRRGLHLRKQRALNS